MVTTIKFTKMQGAGNDYIYVNTLKHLIADPVRTSIRWSSSHGDRFRRAGIDWKINQSIGKYVYDNKLTQKKAITQETLSGIKVLKLHTENELVEEVTVDMDLPLLANSRQINTPDGKMLAKTITVDGKEYKRTFVCM